MEFHIIRDLCAVCDGCDFKRNVKDIDIILFRIVYRSLEIELLTLLQIKRTGDFIEAVFGCGCSLYAVILSGKLCMVAENTAVFRICSVRFFQHFLIHIIGNGIDIQRAGVFKIAVNLTLRKRRFKLRKQCSVCIFVFFRIKIMVNQTGIEYFTIEVRSVNPFCLFDLLFHILKDVVRIPVNKESIDLFRFTQLHIFQRRCAFNGFFAGDELEFHHLQDHACRIADHKENNQKSRNRAYDGICSAGIIGVQCGSDHSRCRSGMTLLFSFCAERRIIAADRIDDADL